MEECERGGESGSRHASGHQGFFIFFFQVCLRLCSPFKHKNNQNQGDGCKPDQIGKNQVEEEQLNIYCYFSLLSSYRNFRIYRVGGCISAARRQIISVNIMDKLIQRVSSPNIWAYSCARQPQPHPGDKLSNKPVVT